MMKRLKEGLKWLRSKKFRHWRSRIYYRYLNWMMEEEYPESPEYLKRKLKVEN